MNILAFSSSRSGESGYLEPALPLIEELAGNRRLKVAFLPFASVGSYDDYLQKVKDALESLSCSVELASGKTARKVIENCDAIMVGGGNTFKLLHDLYELDLVGVLNDLVKSGVPYIGWSAGSNILGPSIATTNDMPIVQPQSFAALNIFPFHINPHYHNQIIQGFNGETRYQRISEFLTLNTGASVAGLPEGTALVTKGAGIIYKGKQDGFFFYFSDGVKINGIKNNQEIGIYRVTRPSG